MGQSSSRENTDALKLIEEETPTNEDTPEPYLVRDPHTPLSEGRKALLDKNRAKLEEAVEMNKEFLQILCNFDVINRDELKIIQEVDMNDRIAKLIKYLKQKTNEAFDHFCRALAHKKLGHVVYSNLLGKDDFYSAVQKIAEFYLAELTNIEQYTGKVTKLPQLYTSGKLHLLTKAHSNYVKEKSLADYEELYKTVEERGHYRCMIDGEAGMGKSTLLKKIAFDWAQKLNPNPDQHYTPKNIHKFKMLLIIVMRYVKMGDLLFSILADQYRFLNTTEVYACIDMLENADSQCILFLDGLDEYRGNISDVAYKIALSSRHSKVVCCTTTRQESMKLLQKREPKLVLTNAGLRGFDEEEIGNYITQFYKEDENGSDLASSLYRCLQKEKPHLMSLATKPMRLEMMCHVWRAHKDLGDSDSDIYEKFAKYKLSH